MIDLRRLHMLRMLREEGTVTATAHALYLTPSAVSQQLRQLARDLGVELLHHEGRRVRLTAAAHILLEHGDVIAEEWERCRADLAAHASGAIGEVRIVSSFEGAFRTLLIPTIRRLQQSHPRLTVTLAGADVQENLSWLLAERADVAVLPVLGTPPIHNRRFDQQLLLDDPQDLIVSRDHWLAGRSTVRLAETAGEQWVAPHPDHHQLIVAACAAAGFNPQVVHEARIWDSAITLVECGLGVCLLPRLVAVGEDRGIVRIPLEGTPAPSRQILTCVRKGTRSLPAVDAVLDALERTARDRESGN